MSEMIPFIGKDVVRRHLQWEPLIKSVETALRNFSRNDGSVIQPVRQSLTIPKYNGWLGCMPAAIMSEGRDILTTKLVTVYPDNSKANLPTHCAVVVLFNCKTGIVEAVMDGCVITEMRTAATSIVAFKHLAPNTKTMAVLGSGVQARSHIQAAFHALDVQQVRVWNYKPEGAIDLVKQMKELFPGKNITTAVDVKSAVANADLIVTATGASKPILMKDWVKPGATIAAVGAPRPDWQEMDPKLVKSSTVVVDSREAALKEAGDVILSGAKIYAEIGEIIGGKLKAHPHAGRTTIFKSLGMAIEDAVGADQVYDGYKTASVEKQ